MTRFAAALLLAALCVTVQADPPDASRGALADLPSRWASRLEPIPPQRLDELGDEEVPAAVFIERLRDGLGAEAIGVGLDDPHEPRARTQPGAEALEILPERGHIDFGLGRPKGRRHRLPVPGGTLRSR